MGDDCTKKDFSVTEEKSKMTCWLFLCTVFMVPGHLPIRGEDDPGLVYVPVGPTSDFRIKVPIPDHESDANNVTHISTASPFGKPSTIFLDESAKGAFINDVT